MANTPAVETFLANGPTFSSPMGQTAVVTTIHGHNGQNGFVILVVFILIRICGEKSKQIGESGRVFLARLLFRFILLFFCVLCALRVFCRVLSETTVT